MARETSDPLIYSLTTALADVLGPVPANEEWNVKLIRAANTLAVGGAEVLVDVTLMNPTSTVEKYLARNIAVAAGVAINVIGPEMLYLGTGWRVRARANLGASLDLILSASRRSTT